ncbi:MAG: SLC13 family permease [Balneolales bacterium]
MITAILSIVSIFIAIMIGNIKRVNIGMLSIAFAFLIGFFLVELAPADIVVGWPLNLFFMLLGITLLFGIATVNGTLALMAKKAVEATMGKTKLIPPVFFLMAGILAALGAGNIAICVLLLPIAMTVASNHHISPLLMATMVIAGSNAGGLSPIAPTGIIASTLSSDQGLDLERSIFLKQIIGQSLLAIVLYFFFKGHRLKDDPAARKFAQLFSVFKFSSKKRSVKDETFDEDTPSDAFNREQIITLIVLHLVVIAIVFGGWHIGLTAFTGAAILFFMCPVKEKAVLESVPWSTIILVCGVSMLVNVSESAGGIDLLTRFLTRMMNEHTAAPIMALIGGTLSLVSSASGVVLPTLIPTVPGLVEETGGNAAQIIPAIVMGAHMVTNSPISTLGALAVASAGKNVNRVKLFNDLFIIAFAGLIFATVIVYLGIV